MLQSLAKIAVTLNLDRFANMVAERFYKNTSDPHVRFSTRFQVLTYHRVSPEAHPYFEPIHPGAFEEQIQFLKCCYRVMSLTDLVYRSQRGELPDRAVAITFDDGYRDNYEFAFPILKKYQVPATIFVATGVIGTGRALWHDRIFDAFRFATVKRVYVSDDHVRELVLEPAEARHRSLELALARARGLYGEAQRQWIEEVEGRLKPDFSIGYSPGMLDWGQIREMHAAGIEFGSHTVTHPILSRIPHDELFKEVQESKQQLCEQLGTQILSFAYPNGKASDYNGGVKSMLKECGYVCAVTTQPGFNRSFSDPFELKRGRPWQNDIDLFRFSFFLQRHGLAS